MAFIGGYSGVENMIPQRAIMPVGPDYRACKAMLGQNILAGHCRRLVNSWVISDNEYRYYIHEPGQGVTRLEGSVQLPFHMEFGESL